jgi:hypothetical protein
MKICYLCRLPRPEAEDRCAICRSEAYQRAPGSPTDDALDQLFVENRFTEAFYCMEARVAAGGEDAETCRRLAWLAWAIDDMRAVQNWAHEAMRLDGASPEPHLLLGLLFRSEDRWREAWEEFGAALRRGPHDEAREAWLRQLRDEAAGKDPDQ